MSQFAQAFWSPDYAGGLGILFGKLQQGVKENQQFLTVARMRADAEELYGQHIGDIGPATDRILDGFGKDEGASVRKAYDSIQGEMHEAASMHSKIAANIRELVVHPFGKWCDQHAARVQNSQDHLQARVKVHDRQAEAVKKLRSQYFNKCRLVEDLEEEDKLAFRGPQNDTVASPQKQSTPTVKIREPDDDDDPDAVMIGDEWYQPDQLKRLLTHMLENIKIGETRVPILGVYQNVSTGADIVEYIQKHMHATSVTYAERIGQDVVSGGFLRLVGNVGNTFANSSKMNYQWRPKTFEMTGVPERKGVPDRLTTILSNTNLELPISGAVGEYLQGWNPLNNTHPNEKPPEKLRREAKESDERYKTGIRKLDLLRCTLEEAMFEHLKYMERCELDRLKAIKAVILDFSGAISNVIPSLQSTVDRMMLFQETIQPLGDLRYLMENYRTGPFIPKVQIYENYYNSVDDQTFGIDLEARARADKKRVPLVVTTILTYLDNHYPLLEGDEARKAVWLADVPLALTHRLRGALNSGKPTTSTTAILAEYEIAIIAATLKLYLLELPDPLVSSSLYDIIKTIYSSPATGDRSASAQRIAVLQNTLSQLRLANIATLDAITTHLARFLELTSADDIYANELVATFAPCILRPRLETSLTFTEKYAARFLRDLLTHKDAIFGELKRAAASATHGMHAGGLSHSVSVARANSMATPTSRHRAPSTDESNRRLHMEERQRAIAASGANGRSRASSPHTPARDGLLETRKQRDSSRGPSETRFPVAVAGATPRNAGTPSHATVASQILARRESLEVPGSVEGSPRSGRWAGFLPTTAGSSDTNSTSGLPTNAQQPPPPPQQQQQQQQQTTVQQAQRLGQQQGFPVSYQPLPRHDEAVQQYAGKGEDVAAPLEQGRSVTLDGPFGYSAARSETATGSTPVRTGAALPSLPALPGAEVEKRESVGRSSGAAGRLARKPGSVSSIGSMHRQMASGARNEDGGREGAASGGERRYVGVELVDKPMDDD